MALNSTITGGVTAKEYFWEQSNTGTGDWQPADGQNNQEAYTPGTTTPGTVYYRRTITSGGCKSESNSVAVTVTPAITNNTIATSNQTVCSGGAIAALDGSPAEGDTDIEYLWEQSSSDAGPWTKAGGTNNLEDYQPTTQTVEETTITYYRRTVKSGSCVDSSMPVAVKVTAVPVASILEGQIIDNRKVTYYCTGTATLTAVDGDGYTFEWFNTADDTAPIFTTREINVGAGSYYVKVTQITDGNACSSTSGVITVEQTILNYVSIRDHQTVCYNEEPAPLIGEIAQSTAGGEPGYQWQVKATEGGVFNNITGAKDKDLELGAHTGDRWYRRITTVGSCAVESDVIKITVLPQIINTLTSANQTICQDSPAQTITGDAVTGGSGQGSYTYAWQQRVGTNGAWAAAPGVSNGSDYTPQSTTAGTYYYKRIVTSGSCAPIESNIVSLTVQPSLTGNTIAGTQAYCQNAPASALTTSGTLSGGTGSYSYTWQQSSTNTETSTWTAATGTNTQASYTPSTATAGTTYYRRIVTSGNCSSTSEEIAVTVTPSITANTISGTQSYCQNAAASALGGEVTGGVTDKTYLWQQSTTNTETSTWTAATGTNTQASYTPSTATGGTMYYRRVVTSESCSSNSNVLAVVVTPSITANTISGTSSYCQNATATALNGTVSGGTGTYAYTWQVKAGESGTWGTISGATLATYVPSTAQAGDFYYKRIVTSGACTNVESNEFKVTVLPGIVNSLIGPTIYSYCENSPATAITGTVSGGDGTNYGYTWQQSSTGTGSWTSASGTNNTAAYTPPTTTAGTTYYRRTVTSGVCAAPVASDKVIAVTVVPAISNNTISGPTSVCFNSQPGQITGSTPSGGYGGYTYLWQQSTDNATWGSAAGTNNLKDYQAPALTLTTRYRRVVSSGTCQASVSAVHTITVNPLPQKPTITNLAAVHYTGETSFTLQANPSNSSGRFTVKNASGQTVSTSATFSSCTLGAGTFTVTYTYSDGTCSNTSDPVTVTIKQSTYKVIIKAKPHPFCQGENVEFEAFVYRDANIVYPYLVNAKGEPVDASGALIQKGAGNLPVWNPDYPYPAEASQLVKEQGYRYFQPIVTGGERVDPSKFSYQWQKNETQNRKNGEYLTSDAGLSSQDYYNVKVSGTLCDAELKDQVSYRMYSADLPDYEVSLAVSPNPMCTSGPVTLTATLDGDFDYWAVADLELQFILTRDKTTYTLNTLPYDGSNTISFTYNPAGTAIGSFIDGDKIHINFTSDVDNYVGGKCAGKTVSNTVELKVHQPVVITSSLPTPVERCEAGSVTFSITATGTDLRYAWYKAGTTPTLLTNSSGKISGATTNSITISNLALTDAGNYYVVVSNGTNSVCTTSAESNKATLVVNPLTRISAQPQPQTLCVGQTASFSVTATGTSVGYQWLKNGAEISGATASTYSIQAVTTADAGSYSVRVTGTCGTLTSDAVALTVYTPPTISAQPQPQALCVGQQASFNVTATGTNLTYQWLKDGSTITGATASSYSIQAVTTADAGSYSVRVTGTCGTLTSDAVALTVDTPPAISAQPKPQAVCVGTGATFNVTATGTDIGYQWLKNGAEISGATENSYTILSTTEADEALYSVRITGSSACSTVTSDAVMLTVNPMITAAAKLLVNPDPVLINEPATFTAETEIGGGTAVIYQWYVWDETTMAWVLEATHTANSPTDDFVIASVEQGELKVKVEIQPRNDGTNCYNALTLETGSITPLPVEILYLKASKQSNDVLLEWATASEQDNKGFEVQVSENGLNYRPLAFVPSKNSNSNTKQVYKFTDKENGKAGTRYYRLKQIDHSGTFEFFGPKMVTFGKVASKVIAFPNPFHDEVTLDIASETSGEMLIVVTDAVGKQLMERKVQVERGFTTEKLKLDAGLPNGLYIIKTQIGGYTQFIKMVKE
ncbi:immunoglobulin domain-containing protein [Pontibacter brevis]